MAWDWKTTLAANDNATASSAAGQEPQTASSRKHPSTKRNRQAGEVTGTRRDAGILLHFTEKTHAAERPGDLPELLYGNEYDCAFCRGTGQLRNEAVCPVCRGSAKVSVSPPGVRCAFCRGRGQVPPRSTVTCCVCKGRGIVPAGPPIRLCPDCKGRGTRRGQSLYCSHCGGVGVVSTPEQSEDSGGASTDSEIGPNCRRKVS